MKNKCSIKVLKEKLILKTIKSEELQDIKAGGSRDVEHQAAIAMLRYLG